MRPDKQGDGEVRVLANALDWSDASTLGYPVIFGGVLIGSITPVIPTGALVSAAVALAVASGELSVPVVLGLAVAAASIGDVVTYAIGRTGGPAVLRRFAGRTSADRWRTSRERFSERGWQVLVAGRLVPAARIPALLTAALLEYPWRRLVPAVAAATSMWAAMYAVLGIVSGGVADSPLVAMGLAVALVTVGMGIASFVERRRSARAGSRG